MRKGAILQIRIVTGVVLFLALVLIGRLYQIQIIQHTQYQEKGQKQYVNTVRDLYTRGSIFLTTKDGEKVSAATIKTGYLLSMDPSRITNIEDTYTKINEITEIDRDTFIKRANRKDSSYQVIKQRISNEEADKIEALRIPGLQMYRSQWRFYPGEDLSARTIGFVGFTSQSGDTLTGRYGLERYYEHVLKRDSGRLTVNFFAEIFGNLGSVIFDTTKSRTGDIVTSIEPTVARMLDNELFETNEKWESSLTGGVIINPKTGEIFAINTIPTFNLNDRTGAEISNFRNPIVSDVYELGSIIKALTMAAGIDSGAVSRKTTYYDSGSLDLDTFTIKNYDGKARGTVTMQEVLNQSLNTGVAFVVNTMGKDIFRKYFKALKLGKETGIDLPSEGRGLISNLDSPRDVEYATASFGQGIALTPIATVRALSAMSNGGTLVTPHIATKIEYQDGTFKNISYPEGDRVFKEETSIEISRMLTEVVDTALSNGTVKFENYSVAAKTGTAQIADRENGGYYENRFLHSFFGYFPSYDPEFLIFLYTVEPKKVRYASETLTEPFINLTKFLINYYNIPPDR